MDKNPEDLIQEIKRLQSSLEILQQEKADMEILLETMTTHSNSVQDQLYKKTQDILIEKADLELLLEATTLHSDIMEEELQQQAEDTKRESQQRLEQFLEAVPVGVLVVDKNGKSYYTNQMAELILGNSAQNYHLLLHSLYRTDTNQPYPVHELPLSRALRGEYATVEDIEIRRDDISIPLEVSATPIFNSQDQIIYAIAAFWDITQRKQAESERIRLAQETEAKEAALRVNIELQTMNMQLQTEIRVRKEAEKQLMLLNEKLQDLATLDGLTGVANRRRLDEYLDQEWRRLSRECLPLSFILCDVDYFKLYNDYYLHQAGDKCLIAVAKAIKTAVRRPADLVARYGGEEFAVVLPNTEISGAVIVAQAIKDAIYTLKIPHERSKASPYISLSIGVSCTQPDIKFAPETLIKSADAALYEAKEQGRNMIVHNIFQLRTFA